MSRILFLASILAAGLALAYYAHQGEDLPVEWNACAARCEMEEPGDRGQGCIDVECNPLLDKE